MGKGPIKPGRGKSQEPLRGLAPGKASGRVVDTSLDQALKRVAKELNAEIWDVAALELQILGDELRRKLETGQITGGATTAAKKRIACIDAAVRGMKRLIAAHT